MASHAVTAIGAAGTGRNQRASAHLLRSRRDDASRKIGGLELENPKSESCRQVQTILTGAKRCDDYVEIRLDISFSVTRCDNDLDPVAVAYATAMLLNDLSPDERTVSAAAARRHVDVSSPYSTAS